MAAFAASTCRVSWRALQAVLARVKVALSDDGLFACSVGHPINNHRCLDAITFSDPEEA